MPIKKKLATDKAAPSVPTVPLKNVKIGRVSKEDVKSQALDTTDPFDNDQWGYKATNNINAVQPPYDPFLLWTYYENSAFLLPAIEAMVTNVDGTGFEVVEQDEEEEGDPVDVAALKRVQTVLSQPWPGSSFKSIRKELRRDVEYSGNSYLEFIRNAMGEVILCRRLDPIYTRMVALGDPITIKVTLPHLEEGIDIELRPRRFVQIVGRTRRYFKEFGVKLDLNAKTGEWANTEREVPIEDRATEVLHFTKIPHHSGYGIPAWITQTPSVAGSRKAEEHNNKFFESGGVPPFVVFLEGGVVSDRTSMDIQEVLYTTGAHKTLGAVVSVAANGGELGKDSKPTVNVVKFDNAAQKDSMFEGYLENSEKRIRGAWRMPPLFVGRTDDYNYASAKASYQVAEKQLFGPEREEFDEIMMLRVIPEIVPEKSSGIVFRSMPITITDIEAQLTALGLVKDAAWVDKEELVDDVNEVADLHLVYVDPPDPIDMMQTVPGTPAPGGSKRTDIQQTPDDPTDDNPKVTRLRPKAPASAQKSDDVVVTLAYELNRIMSGDEMPQEQVVDALNMLKSLSAKDRKRLRSKMADFMHMPEDFMDDELLEAAFDKMA